MITLKKHVKTGNKEFWEFSAEVEGDDPLELFMKAAVLDDAANITVTALGSEENKEARSKRIGELKEQMTAILEQKPLQGPEELSLEKIQATLDELLRTVSQFFPKEEEIKKEALVKEELSEQKEESGHDKVS